jgi:isochorismate synthase
MLEVLLRIPNQQLRRLRCEVSSADAANLVLRGFKGEVHYYRSEAVELDASFWEGFSASANDNAENKSASEYQQMVASAVSAIQKHTVQKVVLSRKLFWDCPGANPKMTFEQLLVNYPSCTVFALKHQEFGSWMGASPEVLLESTEEGYRSMSLAGTRLEGNAHWGQKELEEQKFVTKEVHKSLKEFGGKITRDKQSTFNAGPVEHLLTWVNTNNLALDPKAAVEELHPTPAICGSPSVKAQELIEQLEGYNRSLYAGYLGLFEENVHAIVLLRTMQWFSNGVQFYAGGGITKDSVPLDEWMETQHKISALKELIQIDDLG